MRRNSTGQHEPHIVPRKVAADANAWAARMRKREARPTQPAPVTVPAKGKA